MTTQNAGFELDKISYEVLNKGEVTLLEFMGDDYAPVEAARISYKRTTIDRKDPDQMEKAWSLLTYLLENDHGTPREMIQFKFYVSCPIFVAREWFRHRIGSFNEFSLRYASANDNWYIPAKGRSNIKGNKQHSETIDYFELREKWDDNQKKQFPDLGSWHDYIADTINDICSTAYNAYLRLIKLGLAREMARTILPLGMYTEFYWSVNGRALANFLALRADVNAQWEIRQYAEVIFKIVEYSHPWFAEGVKLFDMKKPNRQYKIAPANEVISNEYPLTKKPYSHED